MTKVTKSHEDFVIVGENIHATRVVLRKGKRVVMMDGLEAVPFKSDSGALRYLTVPDWYKDYQPYEQGQIKHFMIALLNGINGSPEEKEQGAAYLRCEVRRQVLAGAHFLDINVDEVHYDLEIQKRAMKWAVEIVQEASPIPPSIDSSNSEIIAEGLAAYNGRSGRPLVNSVALERLESLEMITEHNAKAIVMATSGTGMPENEQDRVDNAKVIVEKVTSLGVPLKDIFVDAIVFPISVDANFGNHYFDAVREIRTIFGTEIHIGMGLSNVSFGMPKRKLINKAFIHLALESGIDAGLIDPVQTNLRDVFSLDLESESIRLAIEMLLGQDEFCTNYLMAYRDGKLD